MLRVAVVGTWISLLAICYGHVAEDGLEGTIVFPQALESRSEDGAKVIKVADDLVLTLRKSANVFGENIIVRSFKDGGHMEEHLLDAAEFEKDLYQDEDKMAAVAVKDKEGALQMEGVLGLGRRIRPVPEMERSDSGHMAHLLYEVDEGDSRHTRAVREARHRVQVSERQYGSSIYMPSTIYPEVYVISDSLHTSYFKHGYRSAVEYYGIFINAVNLRYKSVSNPKVWVRIMGITLNSAEQDRNYIFPVPRKPSDYIWGVESLYNLTHYIAREHLYSDYDIVFLTTGYDMLGYESQGRNPDYRGFGFEGTACEYYKTGIGEDWYRRFTGVHTFAHEIAHILGCPHDGEASPSNLGNPPGATHCPWNDGYIMSYKDTGLNHFKFSQCCNDMISYIARRNPCLRVVNVPKEKRIRATKFPGSAISLSKQCSWWYPSVTETYAMTSHAMGICLVKCYMPKYYLGWETYTVIPVRDGTPCINDDKACYNGICSKKIVFKNAE